MAVILGRLAGRAGRTVLPEGRGEILQADRAGGLDEDDVVGLEEAAQDRQ
jgi:hypothetical protein